MTSPSFGDQLKALCEQLGTRHAAELCGVTARSLDLWKRGEGNPNRATQVGALSILRRAAAQARRRAAERATPRADP